MKYSDLKTASPEALEGYASEIRNYAEEKGHTGFIAKTAGVVAGATTAVAVEALGAVVAAPTIVGEAVVPIMATGAGKAMQSKVESMLNKPRRDTGLDA